MKKILILLLFVIFGFAAEAQCYKTVYTGYTITRYFYDSQGRLFHTDQIPETKQVEVPCQTRTTYYTREAQRSVNVQVGLVNTNSTYSGNGTNVQVGVVNVNSPNSLYSWGGYSYPGGGANRANVDMWTGGQFHGVLYPESRLFRRTARLFCRW